MHIPHGIKNSNELPHGDGYAERVPPLSLNRSISSAFSLPLHVFPSSSKIETYRVLLVQISKFALQHSLSCFSQRLPYSFNEMEEGESQGTCQEFLVTIPSLKNDSQANSSHVQFKVGILFAKPHTIPS